MVVRRFTVIRTRWTSLVTAEAEYRFQLFR